MNDITKLNEGIIAILENDSEYDYEKKQEKYLEIVDIDEKVDLITVRDKASDICAISHKWNAFHFKERMILKRLKARSIEIEIKIIESLFTDDDVRIKGMTQKLMQRHIDKQPSIRKIRELVEGQEILVEYVLGVFNTFKFNIMKQCNLLVELLKQEDNF